MDDRFIELALDAGLLNYIDHETPRRYFINGHADLKDVAKFAELVVLETRQEAADKIERLREALRMWVKFWEADNIFNDEVLLAEEAMEFTRELLGD